MVEKKDEAKEPKVKLVEPPEPLVEDAKEPTPEAVAEAAPAEVPMRTATIMTDGVRVNIDQGGLTRLEVCEACRRILQLFG